MMLRNLHTIEGETIDLVFSGGPMDDAIDLHFDDALVFPGLINSHDHLDFNLFPQLGRGGYRSYTEWGPDIHREHAATIAQVMRVPVALRSQWGIYKNLLCGVTTVVNHGARLDLHDPLIHVHQPVQSLHSVRFERLWKLRLNNPLRYRQTCAIHTGEGTDAAARIEIDALLRWNLFRRPLVGIHAIAMEPVQVKGFRALVWCPVSNYFLYNTTAPVSMLETTWLFGTDSTLTAGWDIWEHLRFARRMGMVSDEELLAMVTTNAAQVWQLPGYENDHMPGDIVVSQATGSNGFEQFFSTGPEQILLVVSGRRIRLFDSSLLPQLRDFAKDEFYPVRIGDRVKYVQGNLPKLIQTIKDIYPGALFPATEASSAFPAI